MRADLSRFEPAARELCRIRGKDPDELTFPKHGGDRKVPRWLEFAEQLRAHHEREVALALKGMK